MPLHSCALLYFELLLFNQATMQLALLFHTVCTVL